MLPIRHVANSALNPLFVRFVNNWDTRSTPCILIPAIFNRHGVCFVKVMNKWTFLAIATLPLFLTACATPPPPVAFHATDKTALVIDSLDGRTARMLQPDVSSQEPADDLLQQARSLQPHQTAVVILENYSEPEMGTQFRDRGTSWFVTLRGLGYEHIYFLQGNGAASPEGLPTIIHYN